jgi:ATP-dependent DNA ligase
MIDTIPPMLAQPAQPFDSDQYLFEVKWDGIRGLAAVERRTVRLWGRERADYTDCYPELEALRELPCGTAVDGELVVLRGGRADFGAVLGRHQLTSPLKIRLARRHSPVT